MNRIALVTLFSALSLVAACASSDGDADENLDSAASTEQSAETPPAAAQPADDGQTSPEASLTVADIDRWHRGMNAELVAVREAGMQFKAAKSANDSLSAMMAANETSTRAAGARGAGLDESRYGTLRSNMSSVVRYMVPLDVEMDIKDMPADIRTMMEKDREQTLARASSAFPPEVIEALRPRAVELRKQEMALVAERLRAAGMAR
jgi:hypothetical protein